jgi:hypothetical protein
VAIERAKSKVVELVKARNSKAANTLWRFWCQNKGRIVKSKNAKAANTLWRFWRQNKGRTFAKIVKRFRDARLLKEAVISMGFSHLVIHLRRKDVIASGKALFMRLHYMCEFLHPSEIRLDPTINVRKLLAMYMIVFYHADCIEEPDNLSRALMDASVTLQDMVEEIVHQYNDKGRFCLIEENILKSFVPSVGNYITKFNAWKVPDEARLTLRIRHGLHALYHAQNMVPNDEPEDSPLNAELRTQIARLRAKLVQIAGPEQLIDFDRERARNPGLGRIAINVNMVGRGALNSLSHEGLAHELLIDSTYQIGDPQDTTTVSGRIQSQFKHTFWLSVEDDMRFNPPYLHRVWCALQEVYNKIAERCAPRPLSNIPDMAEVRRRYEDGDFARDDVVRFVGAVVLEIKRFQHPFRDLELNRKWTAVKTAFEGVSDADVVEGRITFVRMVRFLSESADILSIDAANARYLFCFVLFQKYRFLIP